MPIGSSLDITLPTDGTADWGEGALNDILTTIIEAIEAGVSPSGLSINSTVDFEGNTASDLGGILFRNGGSPGARSIYFVSNELWVTDGAGNTLQLTTNGAINVSSVASITGLAGSGASAAYSSANKRFTWLDQTTEGAQMEFGQLRLRKAGTTTVATVKAHASQGSDYTITLLTGTIAAGTGLMTMDSTGQVGVTKDPSINTLTATDRVTMQAGAQITGSFRTTGSHVADGLVVSGSYAHTLRWRVEPARADKVVGSNGFEASNTVGLKPLLTGGTCALHYLRLEDGERIRHFGMAWSKQVGATITASLGRVNRSGEITLIQSYAPSQNSGNATGSLTQWVNVTGSDGMGYVSDVSIADSTAWFIRIEMTGSTTTHVSQIVWAVDRPE